MLIGILLTLAFGVLRIFFKYGFVEAMEIRLLSVFIGRVGGGIIGWDCGLFC